MYLCGFTLYLMDIGADKLTGLEVYAIDMDIGADKLTGLEVYAIDNRDYVKKQRSLYNLCLCQLWPPWGHFTFGHIKIYIMLKVYNVLCGIEAHTIFLKGMSWNVLYECVLVHMYI